MDPRDIRSEHCARRFRVYFWRRPLPEQGWTSDEWEADTNDVREALAWAEEQRPVRGDYVLYAVITAPELTLVQLAGIDPVRPTP